MSNQQHLNPNSLSKRAEQLSEPSPLWLAGINDEYCWDSSHPMGWDCPVCRLKQTLPSFFEVVGIIGTLFADVRMHDTDDNTWFWAALKLYDAWVEAHPEIMLDGSSA